jgi:hypothetical protein
VKKRIVTVAAAGVAVTGALGGASIGSADPSFTSFSPVPVANTKSPGVVKATLLPRELDQIAVAQGATNVENPQNGISTYGYQDNGAPEVPVGTATPGAVVNGKVTSITIATDKPFEAQKTEPDKNTYLVLRDQKGADGNYGYGTHFLFQGHEAGTPGSITRLNLDADTLHRVTVLATKEVGPSGANTGANLPTIDGSTWDPFAKRLLFTSESSFPNGGIWQATLDLPSAVENVSKQLGNAGFEGIQNDDLGNLYYVEDTGGARGTGANASARRPNSFVYRFLATDPADLEKGGKIQVLQVLNAGNQPLTYDSTQTADQALADAAKNADFVQLHVYGKSFKTKWITIATTTAATAAAPDLNTLAKAASGTPFKRPENGVFRPGTKFSEFYLAETGDTDARTNKASSGGFGSILKLVQNPKSDDGTISIAYLGDAAHAGFDNVQFLTETKLVAVEDAGDTLHGPAPGGRNALDSAWVIDVTTNYGDAGNKPDRMFAEGRDPSATLDSWLGSLGLASFSNDGDNEITGFHVSNGDPSPRGILGAQRPQPFGGKGEGEGEDGGPWRVFYTQQHGDNTTYEIIHR